MGALDAGGERRHHIKTASAFYELYNPSVVQSGRIEIILNQKAEDEGAFIAGLPARAADITKARSAVKQMLTDYQPLKSSDDEVNRLMWKYFDREDELVAKLEKKYAGKTKSGAGGKGVLLLIFGALVGGAYVLVGKLQQPATAAADGKKAKKGR